MKFSGIALLVILPLLLKAVEVIPKPGAISKQESKQGYSNKRILACPRQTSGLKSLDFFWLEKNIYGFKRVLVPGLSHWVVYEVSAGKTVETQIKAMQHSELYEFVEPDYIVHLASEPNDPRFCRQTSLQNDYLTNGKRNADINALAGWSLNHDASSVVVAIIDSGLRATHEDFKCNLWPGTPLINNDTCGHGTKVAGIIGARGNNNRGITGVAWSAQMMPIQAFDDSEQTDETYMSKIVAALQSVRRQKARIVNCSYVCSYFSEAEYQEIKGAQGEGIIFVAAAGNKEDGFTDNDAYPKYPASYPLDNIVGVTRVDEQACIDNKQSCVGPATVEIAAPGFNMISCGWNSDCEYVDGFSGTSYSTPLVTGALALVASKYAGEHYRLLINRVLRSVNRLRDYDQYPLIATGGMLNLGGALSGAPTSDPKNRDNRPFNDDFSARAPLTGLHAITRGSNLKASAESNEQNHAGQSASRSVWWCWTAPQKNNIVITTEGSSFKTLLSVWKGKDLDCLENVGAVNGEHLSFDADQGTEYAIAVDTADGNTGSIVLAVGKPPENDAFLNATACSGSLVFRNCDNRLSTIEPGETRIDPNYGGHTVWYRWTPTAPDRQTWEVLVAERTFDAALGIFEDLNNDPKNPDLRRIDADVGSNLHNPKRSFEARLGKTYYFAVDSSKVGTGTFTIMVNPDDGSKSRIPPYFKHFYPLFSYEKLGARLLWSD